MCSTEAVLLAYASETERLAGKTSNEDVVVRYRGRINFADVAGDLVTVGVVRSVSLAGILVPLGGEDAVAARRFESQAGATDAGEQVNEREGSGRGCLVVNHARRWPKEQFTQCGYRNLRDSNLAFFPPSYCSDVLSKVLGNALLGENIPDFRKNWVSSGSHYGQNVRFCSQRSRPNIQLSMTPDHLVAIMCSHGATRMIAKRLAPTDNSKHQYFLGRDYSAIQILPFGELREVNTILAGSKQPRLKATVHLDWIKDDGALERAERANLILYPKYPEVRLSGILSGLRDPGPAAVVGKKGEGRWMFLGITAAGTIVARACAADSPCAKWAESLVAESKTATIGVFHEFTLAPVARDDVMTALRKISDKGWIESKRLDRTGSIHPCNAQNCGGYTLEAELGIRPNGRSEPDYDGWEVKQFDVENLARPICGRVTLMTPEPNGGFYAEAGPIEFIRKFGYPAAGASAGRMNFCGRHVFGVRQRRTKLKLTLAGWNADDRTITDLSGGIELHDERGEIAARWSFEALLNHWKRKHAKAVYVPSNRQTSPRRYRYGAKVFTGLGADFAQLLRAFSEGITVYDPGINLKMASGEPVVKRRNQFRVLVRNLGVLYEQSGWKDLPTVR